jgi:hypothetical protein
LYKYQCSKDDCGSRWTLKEGNLNGFVLTCPICGKGRGLFVSQTQRELDKFNNDGLEEIIISIIRDSVKSIEEVNQKIEEFRKKYSLIFSEKNIEWTEKEIIFTIQYKIKT